MLHPDWLKLVIWLASSNQSARFQSRVVMLVWTLYARWTTGLGGCVLGCSGVKIVVVFIYLKYFRKKRITSVAGLIDFFVQYRVIYNNETLPISIQKMKKIGHLLRVYEEKSLKKYQRLLNFCQSNLVTLYLLVGIVLCKWAWQSLAWHDAEKLVLVRLRN